MNSENSRGNSINGKARKDERRKAAIERQNKYAKLSTAQKLALLPKEGATRQRERLQKILEQEKLLKSKDKKAKNTAA